MSESSEGAQNTRKNNKKKKRTSSETKERADSLSETSGLFLGDQNFVPLQQWYVLTWLSLFGHCHLVSNLGIDGQFKFLRFH